MNRQVNPDHCYETEDGVMYEIVPAPYSPEWTVRKNGHLYRSFTSLMAAKGWLEHVLEHPESDKPRVIVAGGGSAEFKAKLAAALNGGVK